MPEQTETDTEYTKSDPFFQSPLHSAFYHPSPPRTLTSKQKKTKLSPERVRHELDRLDLAEKEFLKGSNMISKKRLPTNKEVESSPTDAASSKFDESWPDSERPSTIGLSEMDESLYATAKSYPTDPADWMNFTSPLEKLDKVKGQLEFDEQPDRDRIRGDGAKPGVKSANCGSTLSKYIERFRHGTPMSRDERARLAQNNSGDFWWMRPTSPICTPSSSTPKDESSLDQGHIVAKTRSRVPKAAIKTRHQSSDVERPGKSGSSSHSSLRKSTLSLLDVDSPTKRLQEKADWLLEKTESTLNSSEPAVSTDGVGTSGSTPSFLSHTSSEEPYRPTFTLPQQQDQQFMPMRQGGKDDILRQWRMRRKMELAKSRIQGVSQHDPYQQGEAKVAHVEADTRLAEFRRRLAEGAGCDGLTGGVSTGTMIQFTAAPPGESKPLAGSQHPFSIKKHHTASQALPKEDVKSSLQHSQALPKEDMKSSLQHSQAWPKEDVKSSLQHTVPVASPLHAVQTVGTVPGDQTELCHPSPQHPPSNPAESRSPHFHMSCDILPCPLQKQSCSHQPKMEGLREKAEVDASFEELKLCHMKKLRREQFTQVEKDELPRATDSQEEPERDSNSNQLRGGSQSLQPKGDTVSSKEVRESEVESVVSAMDSRTPLIDTKQIPPAGKHRVSRHKERHAGLKSKRETKFKARLENKPVISPPPRSHSSPKRPLKSTIGQVVGDHLFASSSLSLSNSSLDLPSAETVPETEEQAGGSDMHALLGSDEEEFTSDEILKDLRKRRRLYLDKLQDLDSRLILKTGSQPTDGPVQNPRMLNNKCQGSML